jgi:nitroreductase
MTDTAFPLPTRNDAVLDFLSNRRSNLSKAMSEPGPSEAELERILTIGMRVPDHRKLSPWRITVWQGAARARIGETLRALYVEDNPDHPQERQDFEAKRFLRAPLVLGVYYAPVDCLRGTPKWEQQLSAGAVCFNLCLAAQASGYGAQWLTEWYAYDDRARDALGLNEEEDVAGFIHIGTPTLNASPRARPDLSDIVTINS